MLSQPHPNAGRIRAESKGKTSKAKSGFKASSSKVRPTTARPRVQPSTVKPMQPKRAPKASTSSGVPHPSTKAPSNFQPSPQRQGVKPFRPEPKAQSAAPSMVRPKSSEPARLKPNSPQRVDFDKRAQAGRAPMQRGRELSVVPPTMNRAGRNFDQKVVVRGDQTFVERRYSGHSGPPRHGSARHGSSRHEHSYEGSRYYHRRPYGHHHYDCYVRHWTYNPWFWGFFFAPFAAPWHYSWVWVGSPWHASWGWYYQPYPVYQAPSYWVTDYVISRSLEEEYDRGYAAGQQAAAGQPTPVGAPISEPLKEELRQQVDQTAKAYQGEQAIALEQALQNPGYLFVVDTTLSVTNVDGTVCALSGGDIIKPAAAVDPNVPVAQMRVVTSKGDECPAGSTVAVSLTDLQEMLNSFGQKVDDGMNELQKTKNPQAVTPQ